MTSSGKSQKEYLLLLAGAAASIATFWNLRNQRRDTPVQEDKRALQDDKEPDYIVHDDTYYLEYAHKLRRALIPPQQSNFRVVAIFRLEGGEILCGTNDEPSPNISMAMCAERCALLKYRVEQRTEKVDTIYIVTDANTPVTPGTACREYMSGHFAIDRHTTRIVMQSKDPNSMPILQTLAELYPFPSIYNRLNPQEQMELGKRFELTARKQLEQLHVPDLPAANLTQLVNLAREACDIDNRDSLHAIRYGAAMAMEYGGKIDILSASQIKALEYSSTLDAVCQLSFQVLSRTQKSKGTPRLLALVQVDQFGIPHGPFAAARAFLVEQGFGDCAVILTKLEEENGKDATTITVQTVAALDLAPDVPEFRSRE
mgnify:CR=1 FL=1